jgi:uncharacterized protein with HEPN domain
MLEAIARIRRYVGRKGRAAFLASPLLQDAVIRNIEILGEAAGRVSREFAARHDSIPWQDIAGMRHRLIHGYLKVNLETVWQVVKRDAPALELDLRAIVNGRVATSSSTPRKRTGALPKQRR